MKPLSIFVLFLLLLTRIQALAAQEKTESPGKPARDPKKDDSKKDDPPPKPNPQIPIAAPDNQDKVLGKYLKPGEGESSAIASSPVEKTQWQQVAVDDDVRAGRTYLAWPGCRADLQLKDVKVTMLGILPEILPFLPLVESKLDLHQHPILAVDLTLWTGRIVVTSQAEKPLVRIRFENPNHADHGEIIDLALQGKGTQVLIDRGGRFRMGKPFFKDPKDPKREAPGAFLSVWVLKGNAAARHGGDSYTLRAPPGPARLVWNTLHGLKPPDRFDELPAAVSLDPPLPELADKALRKFRYEIFKARDDFALEPADKAIDVRLAAACKSAEVARRIQAVRCYAAMGAVPQLLERLSDETDPAGWLAVIASIKHWIAVSRDNEYAIFAEVRKRSNEIDSVKIMELLHGLPGPDALVVFLDNSQATIRRLAHLNLCELRPAGLAIPYDAAMDADMRRAAQLAWMKLLHKDDK